MKQSNNHEANLNVHIEDDNCTVKLDGNMDILLQGVVASIHAIIEQLMQDYDEDDFDTEGMDENSFKFCTTAMVLSYIMDNFDCAITAMEMKVQEDEETEESSNNTVNDDKLTEISNNIQSLDFSAFNNEEETIND